MEYIRARSLWAGLFGEKNFREREMGWLHTKFGTKLSEI
jgi:hypothetical protein